MNPSILVWSQNPDLYLLFNHILEKEGFKAALVDDEDLAEQAAQASVSAILLDTENHVERALRACSLIKGDRATAHIPLLALIPGGNEQHCLDLLKAGVDESFVRPASPARILSYLRSIVSQRPEGPELDHREADTINVWEFRIELARRLVTFADEKVQLSPIEFNILCLFLRAPGRVFSRSELIEAAWPPGHYVQPRTVDVHVGRLRRLLEQITGRNIIRTVRNTGYALELGEPEL